MNYHEICRFFSKTAPNQVTGCWDWIGRKDRAGYAPFYWDKKSSYAHRFSFILHKGAIPDGCEIDHICRNRSCSNPEHLRAVSHRENVLAGDTVPARHAAKTHCNHGHEFTLANTYVNTRGERQCRACMKIRSDARRKHLLAA